MHAGLLEQETRAMAQVPAASQLTVDSWAHQAHTLQSAQARSRPSSSPSSRGASDTGDAQPVFPTPDLQVSSNLFVGFPVHQPQHALCGDAGSHALLLCGSLGCACRVRLLLW